MRIRCLHGYFIFEETRAGQVSDFMRYTGFELVPVDDYYTFSDLENAPTYSLAGKTLLLGTAAIKSFEGKPWEVFRENQVVYDFSLGVIMPIQSILTKTVITQAGNKFLSPGLIMPGSIMDDGNRVKDYSAWFSLQTLRYLYSDVAYV